MEAKLSRNPAVDFAPMKQESVLFQSQTNQFCLLNSTATFMWSLLERPCTVQEVASALCDHFDSVNLAEAVQDVERTAKQLLSLSFLRSSSN
jgi:hypothetical protein